jgi:hypothetical protein
MILSIGPALAKKLRAPAPGAVIALDVQTTPDLAGVTTALGGGPVLLHAGQAPDWRPPQPRHPRTALGWNDEHFFLLVVDGRQKSLSCGCYPGWQHHARLGCTSHQPRRRRLSTPGWTHIMVAVRRAWLPGNSLVVVSNGKTGTKQAGD